MDIVVKGRHTEITERFREHVAEKLAKVEKLDPKVISVDVEVLQGAATPGSPTSASASRSPIRSRGPVDPGRGRRARTAYAALDLADDQARGTAAPCRTTGAGCTTARRPRCRSPRPTAALDGAAARGRPEPDGHGGYGRPAPSDGPMVVREKVHAAKPMDLDQALYEMELVGHDFFLFVDADDASSRASSTGAAAYDYGVIRLAV